MFALFALVGATSALQARAAVDSDAVLELYKKEEATPELEKAFSEVYESFLRDFDVRAHDHLLAQLEPGVESFLESKAATGYATIPGQPHCDTPGVSVSTPNVKAMAPFPGGASKRLFGFDLTKLVEKLSAKANGAASASGIFPPILAMQALNMGSGLVKGAVSTVLQVVPPLIPPPVWTNSPLPCLPMVTGHNCFGATPYLITAADFMTADVTDSQLDGVIAGFPALYKAKVGKTSDAAYKACFAAYMSMQCASIFPRCQAPASREEPSPAGRVPMCFTHCIATLVLCPGLWLDDIMGECSMVSVPPMCTMATFANFYLLPPQYASFEESEPTPLECPKVPASLRAIEPTTDFGMYGTGSEEIAASPYGVGAAKLPTA